MHRIEAMVHMLYALVVTSFLMLCNFYFSSLMPNTTFVTLILILSFIPTVLKKKILKTERKLSLELRALNLELAKKLTFTVCYGGRERHTHITDAHKTVSDLISTISDLNATISDSIPDCK